MESALATVQAEIVTIGTSLGGKVALAAVAGITLGSVGFGIRYIYRMFKGTAK